MKKLFSVSLFAMIGFFALLASRSEAQVPIGSVVRPTCRVRAHAGTMRHRHIIHAIRWQVHPARTARHRW